MFTVPDSSSPVPSTPDRSARHKSRNAYSSFNDPSTTPAGPPPTSLTNQSTTPAGPPPSSVFGSVLYESSRLSPLNARNAPRQRVAALDQDHDMLGLNDSILGDQFQRSGETSGLAALARGLASGPAPLHNSGVVLSTENVLQKLWAFEQRHLDDQDTRERALAVAVKDLVTLWRSEPDRNIQTEGIGPGKAASSSSKALFLASLLFSLHHPFLHSHNPATHFASSDASPSDPPIPEVLLDWLRDYHDPYPEDFSEVMNAEYGPASHERFWDGIYSLTLRGRLKDVSQMFKEANFRYAVTALDDGSEQPGYTDKQLANVQRVIKRAISVTDSCPVLQAGNWNVKGLEWSTFRKRIRQALSDLETFAEGSARDSDLPDPQKPLHAENFGISGMSPHDFSVSRMSQRAQSQVPWSVYECLKQFYGQLLGMRNEIISASADWVEATIGLTVWWDGEDDDMSKQNFSSSRRPASRNQHTRVVDLRPRLAYQEKLALSLQQVRVESSEPELQVNGMDPAEVGLACVFEGNLEGVLSIVRGWSTTIATAIVEIAHGGSWLNPSQRIMNDLNEEDFLLLSYGGKEPRGINFDQTLITYAELLSQQDKFYSRTKQKGVEGWELAIQVLTRLDNEDLGEKHIESILAGLTMTTSERIEKVMNLCDRFDLPGQGRATAEKYANYLASNTGDFGGALFYYARAHQPERVKEVLNVLISSCLVQSRSFPPISELDQKLRGLIEAPRASLSRLGDTDNEASDILSNNLSGYAMLRRFYDLRDETDPKNKNLGDLARKRQAASALISVILSASDSIHGGLYDPSVDSVVQVDGLLVLLGEALVFLNQRRRVLDSHQIFTLLKAAEDIETVPSGGVFAQCEECLKSAIASANGQKPPQPQAVLRKSLGAGVTEAPASSSSSMLLTGSGQFEMVGSAITTGSSQGNSLEASGVLVEESGEQDKGDKEDQNKIHRGWDWRRGLSPSTKGHDVLQILRLGLARELSRTWTEGEF